MLFGMRILLRKSVAAIVALSMLSGVIAPAAAQAQ